jgi:thioredoxin-related protein
MKNYLRFSYLLILVVIAGMNNIIYSQLSFEDALAKAKTENKRVIVDVYTDWCSWCKKMDKDVYGNSEIKKIVKKNFVFVKLNAESSETINYIGRKYTGEELALYFEATGYPTTVFLEPDGSIIKFKYDSVTMKNIPGYFKKDEFKKILNFFKDGKYKDSDLSKEV